MRLSPKKRKTKATLDLRLTGGQREEFFRYCESHTLEEAEAHLRRKYKFRLSSKGISKWLEKRRSKDEDRQFIATLSCMSASRKRSEELVNAIGGNGGISDINQSNLLLIGKVVHDVLLDALLKKDTKRAAAVLYWAEAVKALAADKRADAQKQDSETSRDKFQFDAAAAARKYARELMEINRSKASEREKTERAVVLLFGKRPENLGVAP
jgi:hypothetical protein